MHSSAMRRRAAASDPNRGRRLLALIAGLFVIGGTVVVTQFASAEDNQTQACETANVTAAQDGNGRRGDRDRRRRPRPEQPPAPSDSAPPPEEPSAPPEEPPSEPPAEEPTEQPTEEPGSPAPEEPSTPPEDCDEEGEGGGTQPPPPPPNNGLEILGNNCDPSGLEPHRGFQEAPRCVSTAFGEVSAQENNPSLLITQAPRRVDVNTPFTLQVSTRNLVRDRFLGAAAGGYYLESAYLTEDGLTRGHFHVACRMLESTRVAPDPAPVPAFFRAIEDGGGGDEPDQVTVEVTGMPATGTASCAVWAGDGSHRIPMMTRANQTPAFDVVRIRVTN